MKNIVIRSGSLRMGGLERVLIEVLQNLNLEKYRVSLIIEDDSGEENIFLGDIPKKIEVYFIKPKDMIDKTHYHRVRKKNIFNKIIYNYLMYKEHKFVVKRTLEIMKEIEEKYGRVETFIDYDWGARRYAEKIEADKKIIWLHNSMPKMLKKESKIKRFGENLKKYDVIVAICDEMKEELQRTYVDIKDKIVRIYNPFNFERILKLSEDKEGLSSYELELLKDRYIVAVSRLDTKQKDYKTLIEGFRRAKEEGLEEKLYIVGDGPDRKEIEEIIKKKGLESEVLLVGRKKNPYIWMKNSELFVHSSNYEGFGLVLVEAAILGKTVVSSNCEVGPKEILGDGKYGLLFDVGDYKKLAEILNKLFSNRKLLKYYSEKARERAKEFSVDEIMREYEKIIG